MHARITIIQLFTAILMLIQSYRRFEINTALLAFIFLERPLVEYCMRFLLTVSPTKRRQRRQQSVRFFSARFFRFGEIRDFAQFVMQLLLATCFVAKLDLHVLSLDLVQVKFFFRTKERIRVRGMWVATGKMR